MITSLNKIDALMASMALLNCSFANSAQASVRDHGARYQTFVLGSRVGGSQVDLSSEPAEIDAPSFQSLRVFQSDVITSALPIDVFASAMPVKVNVICDFIRQSFTDSTVTNGPFIGRMTFPVLEADPQLMPIAASLWNAIPVGVRLPSVWSDEGEIAFEWKWGEKHHAILSVEEGGIVGYAMLIGDQFSPGRETASSTTFPKDLEFYLRET